MKMQVWIVPRGVALSTSAIMIIATWTVMITGAGGVPDAASAAIRINVSHTLNELEKTYASFNIDASCNRGFHQTHFANPNLRAAARGLSPSKLRFGGSGHDYLVYGLSPGSPECSHLPPLTSCSYFTPGCLNATHWDNLYGLAEHSGSDFIFGVSFDLGVACKKAGSSRTYHWNATNVASLLSYLATKKQRVFGFELGNEINNAGGPPCNLTADMQADALVAFSKLVQATLPGTRLIGPDTGGRDPLPWLRAYLPTQAGAMLHAVTHHVYPGVSRSSYNAPEKLDGTADEISWYTSVVKTLAPNAQIWAGEDGPKGGGDDGTCGKDSVCSTYASAVWYADDLANRAKHGFVQYQRQTLFGGSYGLTASATPHPQSALGAEEALLLRPGYYVNFLWKRLLGTRVLNASSTNRYVRSYAFTGVPPSPYAPRECTEAGSVQLLLLNLRNHTSMSISFDFLSFGSLMRYTAWTLEPPKGDSAAGGGRSALNPFASRARLNGKELPQSVDLEPGAPEPAFLREVGAGTSGTVATGAELPPLSITFVCTHAL